jgi:hypothetical protein
VDPLRRTTANFVGALPLACAVSLAVWRDAQASIWGVLLAVMSGAVTSGLGYASGMPRWTASR